MKRIVSFILIIALAVCFLAPSVEAAKLGNLISWTSGGTTYYRGYLVSGIVNQTIGTVARNTDSSAHKYTSAWQYWSQGAATNDYMRSYGCRVVAQAKLLSESGVINPKTVNPDVYLKWLMENGYVSSGLAEQYKDSGNTGDGMIKYAKSVYGVTITRGGTISLSGNFSSSSSSSDRDKIMQKLNEGYHIILGCGAHHAYIGRELSLALGEPIVLNSGSDRSSSANHAHTLRRDSTVAYTYAYCYRVGPAPTPTVTFDANGGVCSTASKVVTTGSAIGTLPIAAKDGYVFAGWFTGGSNYVGASTTVTASTNFTLYAKFFPSYPTKRVSATVTGINATRVTDALIIFNNSQKSTGTNQYGYEVFVDSSGKVIRTEDYVGSGTVPQRGFIISGHGAMRAWLKENVRVGDSIAFDVANMKLIVYDRFARGDFDESGDVDSDDAIYLLYSVFFGNESYPIAQSCDFDADGDVNANDAIYLLYHVFFGDELYPLN